MRKLIIALAADVVRLQEQIEALIIISFLVFCVTLAICLLIGGFVLNLLFVAIAAIFVGLSWVWQKLTKRDWPDEPRV